ncbi:amidohydrolase [Bosea sp. Root381]|uniref:amidohydrolase n=1 Tax=Bosea sp. Root381 TaxID=1736524 RepID=UPI0006F8FAB4|nr:amidohydrolase [Bosea sp. Root381]KRE09711.1 amidohydrolase [Bosea sp. Root381]
MASERSNRTAISEHLLAELDARAGDYAGLADRIWEYAELGFSETRSAADQISTLEGEGFRITRNIAAIPTAFVAEAGEGGPVIGFLGEFDALANLSQLPGLAEQKPLAADEPGHGCGHHLLGTGSALAAASVAAALKEHGLPGRVRYYACPAEEGGSGKVFMARAGAFDDLDAAFSWHPSSFWGVYASDTLAVIHAIFTFSGQSSHAAASPHLGRSALDAAELMNVGVNFLREHMLPEARVHYAFRDVGGIAANVVQASSALSYVIRAPNLTEVMSLFERVKDVGRGAALMTGTQVKINVESGVSNVLPNSVLERLLDEQIRQIGTTPFGTEDFVAADAFAATFTADQIRHSIKTFGGGVPARRSLHDGIVPFDGKPTRMPVSTDVGDVSWLTPTGRVWGPCYAIGTSYHSWQMVAQGKLATAHKGMLQAARALALAGLHALGDPELLRQARAELDERRNGEPYTCPIPPEVLPALPM